MMRAQGEQRTLVRVEISEEAAAQFKAAVDRQGSTQILVASQMVQWFLSLTPTQQERWQFGDREAVMEEYLEGVTRRAAAAAAAAEEVTGRDVRHTTPHSPQPRSDIPRGLPTRNRSRPEGRR